MWRRTARGAELAIIVFVAFAVVAALVAPVASAGSAVAPVAPFDVRVTHDIVYRTIDGEALRIDAYMPNARTNKRPAILFVHGGAWQGGDKTNFTDDATRLAALGYAAFSVNYRLAPAHPYPAAVDDVEAAVRWLRKPEQVKTYRLDPKRVGAVGASAGGHLVAMLATLGQGSRTTGARIKAAVSWSGPMDFHLWTRASLAASGLDDPIVNFLGCEPEDASCQNATEASPISHVDATDAPMLLVNSDAELIGLDHATTMHAALQRAGVPDQLIVLPGDLHAQAFADQVWDDTVAFLERYVGRPPAVRVP
jgi:acetyl esterase